MSLKTLALLLLTTVCICAASAGSTGCDDGDSRCKPLRIGIDPNDAVFICDCNLENCEPWTCEEHSDCDDYSYCSQPVGQCFESYQCINEWDCPADLTCDPDRGVCTETSP